MDSNDPEILRLQEFELHRQRLIKFYKEYNPDELEKVDETLHQWSGREAELFAQLSEKYQTGERAKAAANEEFRRTVKGLKKIYKNKIRPLEEMYKFDHFFNPLLEDVDFDAKPIVLLLGQYSVGKTTFIRHLIKRDFPGIRIGPEPTTDRFVCVMHGEHDQVIPGNALCVAGDKPFKALNKFGTNFLNRMEGSCCNAKILEDITFVDSPGVLSGEKQRIGRQYDFTAVIEWFASRADRILLLFDAHKLDVSDEFKRSINALRGQDDKIRVVLNKADSVSPKQLMRVYGALMWSLGKVVNTPEVLRVYIGSFWDKPMDQNHECIRLFESEAQDLISDLKSLPRNSAIRKVNELVKRARSAKVHALIIENLRTKMPSWFGKSSKQKEILENLPKEFEKIAAKCKLPRGDFPDIQRFKTLLSSFDLSKFPKLSQKAIQRLDTVLSADIPALMKQMHLQSEDAVKEQQVQLEMANPFSSNDASVPMRGRRGSSTAGWAITQAQKTHSDNIFYASTLTNGKLAGVEARKVLSNSGLANNMLFKVWTLADVDKTNQLDADEFAVAMFLIKQLQAGQDLPDVLPPSWIPPSKRN